MKRYFTLDTALQLYLGGLTVALIASAFGLPEPIERLLSFYVHCLFVLAIILSVVVFCWIGSTSTTKKPYVSPPDPDLPLSVRIIRRSMWLAQIPALAAAGHEITAFAFIVLTVLIIILNRVSEKVREGNAEEA